MTTPTFRAGEPLRRRFFIGTGSQVACIDAETGETIWQQPVGGSTMRSLLLFKDLLFTAGNGSAACLTTDGEVRWQTKVPVSEPVTMALDPGVPGGQLLLGGAGMLFALSADQGVLQWKNELPGMGYNPICLRAPGLVATNATMVQQSKYMVMIENDQVG